MVWKTRARACTLFSGSSGNSIYIEGSRSSLLVDAGVSCKRLEHAMHEREIDPASLQGILVTHEHSDHIAGLSVLARRYRIPVYMSELTFRAAENKLAFSEKMDIRFIKADERFELGEMAVKPFRTPHDAAESLGFRIDTGQAVFSVASDIGRWTESIAEAVSGSDLVFIESNYDPDMLWTGPYPWPLKKRIDSDQGHLSNAACGSAMTRLLEEGTRRFVLIHLSEENNMPNLAYQSAEDSLKAFGASNGTDYTLLTAPRHSPGCWLNL